MVTLTQDVKIADSPSLVLCSPEGDYQDTDLVLFAEAKDPTFATAQFQAQFAKYGPVVYQYNTPEELGAALFALDPASTHDSVALYKEEAARDAARKAGTLAPSDPAPADNPPDQTDAAQNQDSSSSAGADAPSDSSGQVLGDSTTGDSASSTPDIASSTPDAIPGDTATTTPDLPPLEMPDTNTSTTTPAAALPDDSQLSTSTPQ